MTSISALEAHVPGLRETENERTELLRQGSELATKMSPRKIKEVADYRERSRPRRETSISPPSLNEYRNQDEYRGEGPRPHCLYVKRHCLGVQE